MSEFKTSLVYIEFGGQPGLHSKTVSKGNKEKKMAMTTSLGRQSSTEGDKPTTSVETLDPATPEV